MKTIFSLNLVLRCLLVHVFLIMGLLKVFVPIYVNEVIIFKLNFSKR